MSLLRTSIILLSLHAPSCSSADLVLPTDAWYEIISNTQDPDAFGSAVRTLMQTNTQMAEYISNNTVSLINRCSEAFSISPLTAALFIGTSQSLEYFTKRIRTAKQDERGQLLDDSIRYYTGSPASTNALKKTLESGVKIKKKYAAVSKAGTVVSNKSGKPMLECYAVQSPSQRSRSWGVNGSSVELAGIPWSIAVDADAQLVVLGTRPTQGTPEYDLFLQTVSHDGTSCSRPVVLGRFPTTLVPMQLMIQPHTQHRVCILSPQHTQDTLHIVLVNAAGTMLAQQVITRCRQNRMKNRSNNPDDQENQQCAFLTKQPHRLFQK